MDNYRVNLEIFEGPLDLLLFLIRKNHIDVYDIPIAFLLDEYLNHLETLKELDIDLAAEFLFMASELTYIKSQLLLPDEKTGDDQGDLDPRADLVQRLIDYQRYKEAAFEMDKWSRVGRDVFSPPATLPEEEKPISAEVGSLWKSFNRLIEKLPPETAHQVQAEHVSVGERMLAIMETLSPGRSVSWRDLIPDNPTKMKLIVTFLAILEMCKLSLITVHQPDPARIYIIATERINVADKESFADLDVSTGYGE